MKLFILLITVYMAIVSVQSHSHGHNDYKEATCEIKEDSGQIDYPISGVINFEQGHDMVTVYIDLQGFNETDNEEYHGFHIHSFGDMSNKCKGSGGHYNPMNTSHGAPNDTERHMGDLGHIKEQSNGRIVTNFVDHMISLNGQYSIIGKAVVVHAGADDFGRGNNTGSKTTGNAGARIGCCVIHGVDISGSSTLSLNFLSLILTVILALSLSVSRAQL